MPTDFKKVDAIVDQMMKAGLLSLGNDVKKRAVILAPYGATRTSGTHLRSTAKVHVSSTKDIVTISFNKPYAALRHEVNNLHPATRKYLSNALKSIKSVNKYFKKF